MNIWDKLIRGSEYRKTRFHSEKGEFGIKDARDILDMCNSFYSHLRRITTGKLPVLPWLTYPAIRYLEDRIQPGWKIFEYGGGMSSIYFRKITEHVYTVESDKAWYQSLLDQGVENIYLLQDDAYISKVRDFPEKYFDLIVIDGNYDRKACFDVSELHLRKDGIIVFDDSDKHQIVKGPISDLDELITDSDDYHPARFTGWVPGSFWVKETTIITINK